MYVQAVTGGGVYVHVCGGVHVQALTEQLETLWTLLDAPEKEVVHVRRYCMSEGSATNVAHLFYQVSRWTQYKMQVQVSSICNLRALEYAP
jgi:hypothetical protein